MTREILQKPLRQGGTGTSGIMLTDATVQQCAMYVERRGVRKTMAGPDDHYHGNFADRGTRYTLKIDCEPPVSVVQFATMTDDRDGVDGAMRDFLKLSGSREVDDKPRLAEMGKKYGFR